MYADTQSNTADALHKQPLLSLAALLVCCAGQAAHPRRWLSHSVLLTSPPPERSTRSLKQPSLSPFWLTTQMACHSNSWWQRWSSCWVWGGTCRAAGMASGLLWQLLTFHQVCKWSCRVNC